MIFNIEFPGIGYVPETGDFIRLKTMNVTGTKNQKGYLQIYANKKRWVASRLAWKFYYNRWPSRVIDHINRIKDDNRIDNLRDVTYSENNKNRFVEYPQKPVGLTGVKGVCKTDRGDYIVRCWDKEKAKQVYLGRADSIDHAKRIMTAQFTAQG